MHTEQSNQVSVHSIQNKRDVKLYDNMFTFNNQLNSQQITCLELNNNMKQLAYTLKTNTRDIMKIKKQIEARPTQTLMTQTLILINAGIQTDPNIIKLLKSRQAKQEQQNQLKHAACVLSKRISQISESVSILMGYFKNLDKRQAQFQSQIKGIVNQKTNSIQQQLDGFKAQQISSKLELQQKIQQVLYDSSQRIRDMQTKTSWKLQQMKTRLQQKVSQQKLISQVKRVQKQMLDRMRDFQVDSNIDPQRLEQIQIKLQQNNDKLKRQMTLCEFNIKNIKQNIAQNLITKEFHNNDRVNIQKRITLLITNQKDNYQRLLKCEQIEQQMVKDVGFLKQKTLHSCTQIQNTKKVLVNLKITPQFQEMLSKMNPEQILQLQKRADLQDFELKSIYKQLNLIKRQVDSANSRLKGTGIIVPNMERDKDLNKKDIEQAIQKYFIQNRFANKINTIHNQLIQNKVTVDLVKQINKKLSRLQKESQYEKLIYEMKQLELYMKQQLKLMSDEIKQSEFKSANLTFRNSLLQSRSRMNSQLQSKKQFFDKTLFRNTVSSTRRSQNKL